jgi:hypothetical protein
MPFFSRLWQSTAVDRQPVGYPPAFGFFRLPRGVPRRLLPEAYQSSSQRSIPTTVKNGSNTLHKGRSVKLEIRMFPATTRTFTKDTALSEQGRGAAWRVWINARHGRGTACYVWIRLKSSPLPPSWRTIGCLHVRTMLKLFCFLCHPKLNFVPFFSNYVICKAVFSIYFSISSPEIHLHCVCDGSTFLLSIGRRPHTSREQRTCNWVGYSDKKY